MRSRVGRDQLVMHLREALPDWDVPTPSGGLSLWVGRGEPVATSLAVLARARELAITAGPRFTVDGSRERFLRLPFTAPLDELGRGVAVLRERWPTAGRSGRRSTAVESVV